METVTFRFAGFLYHFGLAVWIGGSLALGGLAAPALFRELERSRAGAIFGGILRRFSRMRAAALLVAIAGGIWRTVAWESSVLDTPFSMFSAIVVARWLCLVVLAVALLYEIGVLEPAIGRRRQILENDQKPASGDAEFGTLHRRSELLMKGMVVVACLALFFD
ncbi:MAG TPA: DUF4149 domain-containing protein [Thermoanaerobaculia bacterium]|nr:DUF4149 domain-containing protein [Thermoanaerobaculia bacterium]